MKSCTVEQIRELDRIATYEYNIPSIVLMENAGSGAAQVIISTIGKQKNIAIFCGKGNNGGDGFVIARHLHNSNINVAVFCLADPNTIPQNSDPGINLRILQKMKIPIYQVSHKDALDKHSDFLKNCDYIIDAIFGTGLSRDISGNFFDIMNKIKSWNKHSIAIDTPSGLDCNHGEILGVVLPAVITITFALAKNGFFVKHGPQVTGSIKVIDISIPRELIESTT